MRTLLLPLLLLGLLVAGCAETADSVDNMRNHTLGDVQAATTPEPLEPTGDVTHDEPVTEPCCDGMMGGGMMMDPVAYCDSLCGEDRDAYCSDELTIMVGDVAVTGTCRAFSQDDHPTDFNKCEGFCKGYPKRTTYCTVDGQVDVNCDGR